MLTLNSEIGVLIGAAIGHGCLATRTLWGVIERTTPKAVLLATDYGPVWFPRKVLRPMDTKSGGMYKLAHWFTPNGYQARIFDRVEANMISASM